MAGTVEPMRILYRLTAILRLGVRQKMVLVLLGVLSLSLTFTGWLTLREQKQDVLHETMQRGEDLSRFVSQALAFSVVGYDYHAVQMLLDEIVQSQDIAYARVVSDQGNLMAESGHGGVSSSDGATFQRDIVFDGQKVGALSLGLDNTRIINQMEQRRDALIKREAFIILLIALGEFLALSYLIVRPVTLIASSLGNGVADDGTISRDIPLTGDDEFGNLATQFNRMRAQLNVVNQRLQSKIDLADTQLRESNRQLLRQSSELRRVNEELTKLSITDPLTGLYNRRHFEGIMEAELAMISRQAEPCSVLLIDIDHFKRVNDTYGHKSGDAVLQRVSSLLESSLRKSDVVCRIGGEEFVALCRHAGADEAAKIGEHLRKRVEETPIEVNGEQVAVTVSIGITSVAASADVPSAEECFRQADAALYASKSDGRNRVTEFSQLDFAAHSRQA